MEEKYFLVLDQHPFIKAMSLEVKKHFFTLLTPKIFQPGESVVKEGEIIDAIYFIAKGHAEVRKKNDLLAVLHAGESIGLSETGFFSTSGERTATVSALSVLKVFCIGLQQLQSFFGLYPFLNQTMAEQNTLYLKLNFIKKVLPFADVKPEILQKLLDKIEEIHVPGRTVIFHQGEQGEVCYLIKSGEVHITLQSQQTPIKTLAALQASQLFGEAALLLNTPRNATATAVTDTALFVIHKSVLTEIMEKAPETEKRIILLHQRRARPLKKPNVQAFTHQTVEGERVITLKHPQKIAYFQLSSHGWYLWKLLDGTHSVKEILKLFYKKFRLLDIRMILDFMIDLKEAEFIDLDMKTLPETKLPRGVQFLIDLRRMMEFNFSFKNVDRWTTKSYERFFWIFYTKPLQTIMGIIAILGTGSFILHAPSAFSLLNSSHANIYIVLTSFYAMLILLIFHELAHAYTTKAFGRQVHAFGIGWFWLSPVFFCDTSDMWLCPDKFSRIAVDLAGIYLNIILGGLAAVLLLFIPLSTVSLFLWLFCLFNYLTAFANLNPGLEFDGYYMVMDMLNKPNLRESAILMVMEKSHTKEGILNKIKQYPKEMIYLMVCSVYLAIASFLPYFLMRYIFQGVFGGYSPAIGILGSLLAIVFSSLGIWAEYHKRRRTHFSQKT